MKEIERRVELLSSMLASPISENDHAEKWRRSVLQRYVFVWVCISFTYPYLRKLEGVIVKLEPLSKQHALLRFLHNASNVKTLAGYLQELADAITDYQV